jgi:hypothetical protein
VFLAVLCVDESKSELDTLFVLVRVVTELTAPACGGRCGRADAAAVLLPLVAAWLWVL